MAVATRGRGVVGELGESEGSTPARLWTWATLAAVGLAGAVALLFTYRWVELLQADSYKALYDGAWIAHHGIPHLESFSVAAHGRSWIDEQWLAELVYYEVWQVGGYGLLSVAAAGLVALAYMSLAALLRQRGASAMAAVGWTTLAIFTAIGWTFIRAQNFALPLFVGLLVLCLTDAAHEQPQRRLLLLLPLLAVWANLHGSVLLGAALASAYLLYRATTMIRRGSRRAAFECFVLAACAVLMPLATPYGIHILDYYREFIGNAPIAALASEWDAPHGFFFYELYGPLTLVVVALIHASVKRHSPPWVLVAAVAVTAAAGSVEAGSIVWFGMVAAVVIAESTRSIAPVRDPARGFLVIMTTAAIALTAFVLGTLGTRSPEDYEAKTAIPAANAAAEYASSHPCALILADNWDASALLWHDPWLAGRVGFDARLEQFPQPALTSWIIFEVARARAWPATTGHYQVLIGNSAYTPALVRRLAQFSGAAVLARDSRGIAVLKGEARGQDRNARPPRANRCP